MDKAKLWVKNVIKNVTQWLGLSVSDLKVGLKQPSNFLSVPFNNFHQQKQVH